MKGIKPTLIAGIIFCSQLSYSQAVSNDNEFDRKYAPNQNSIFNNMLKKSDPFESQSAETEILNSIKFYPTMTIRQKIFFSYDRDLGKGFCLSAGIGKAFGTDIIQSTWFDLADVSDASMPPATVIANSQYTGSTPLFSAGAKIYFSGKTFDGGYIDFNYRRESMSYLLTPLVNNVRVDGTSDVKFKMNAAYFGFGITGTTGKENNFTHDFYINFGIKSFLYTGYEIVQQPIGTSTFENVYRKTGVDASARILPSVNMGYAFGFGWK